MATKLKFYLYGVEIHLYAADIDVHFSGLLPHKGDHILWNGALLEVAMVVWNPAGAVHLYLARDPFNNP